MILLVHETGYIFVKWKTRIQGLLFLICLSTLVNSICYFVAIQASTLNEYMIGLVLSYMGRVWIPFSLLLFVTALCKRKIYKPLVAVLGIIHLLIFVIVVTNNYHYLYYKNVYLDTSGIFPYLGKENGIIHDLYNYLIIIYMVV